jgi:hypothetical protein
LSRWNYVSNIAANEAQFRQVVPAAHLNKRIGLNTATLEDTLGPNNLVRPCIPNAESFGLQPPLRYIWNRTFTATCIEGILWSFSNI